MENKVALIQTIGKIVVFLMLLLSIFLFTVKTRNKLSNRLFGLYLLVIAFDLIGLFTDKTIELPDLYTLKTASSLLQLPLFYLYVLSACYSNFKIKSVHLLHGLLFIIFVATFKVIGHTRTTKLIFEVFGELQFLAYIIAVFMVLREFKTVYLENYSNANQAIYKWLFQITVLFCVAHSFVLLRLFLSNSGFEHYILPTNIIISFSVLFITTFFVLQALYKPDLFTGVNINLKPMKLMNQGKQGPAKMQNDARSSENLRKLTSFMKNKKPYLDFELTLQKLAVQTDIPEKELSFLINRYLGKHFFDFINEYRVKEAKNILANQNEKDVTILEVLYQVGFNSKSSFYTAFKKITNKTPTQYRKETLLSKN